MDKSNDFTVEQIRKQQQQPGGQKRHRRRREELFLSYKISNEEQSTDPNEIRKVLERAIQDLEGGNKQQQKGSIGYFDMVSIHSPLTTKEKRLGTYKALIQLKRESRLVKNVGVCNYGLNPLMEILDLVDTHGGLEEMLPAMNQLELSPFNRHSEVVKFCEARNIAVGCGAWSKLSNPDTGPKQQWEMLSDLASKKNVTKAQLLVAWSLQSGYVCVPRSSSKAKLERTAIIENTYGGTNKLYKQPIIAVVKDERTGETQTKKIVTVRPQDSSLYLTDEEMKFLNGLDVSWKAGKLRRTDGWE